MRGARVLFLASWLLLSIVLAVTTFLSAESLWVATEAPDDHITPTYTLEQVKAEGGDEAVKALRGRRVTAATWALGYSLLGLFVVLVPYRRGERWAWWALLLSLGLSQLLSLLRIPLLGTTHGGGAPGMLLALTLLALLAGAIYLFKREVVATVE